VTTPKAGESAEPTERDEMKARCADLESKLRGVDHALTEVGQAPRDGNRLAAILALGVAKTGLESERDELEDQNRYFRTEIDLLQEKLANAHKEIERLQREKYGTPCKCEAWMETAHAAEERAEKAEAAVEQAKEEGRREREKYYELLYAVAQKWPGETRHQTALRYIMEREQRVSVATEAVTRSSPYDLSNPHHPAHKRRKP